MLAKQSSGAVLDLRDHLTPTRSRPGTGDINAGCAEKLPAAKLHNSLQCLLPLRVEKARALSGAGTFAHRLPSSLLPSSSRLGLLLRSFFWFLFFSSFHNPQKPLAAEAPT